MVRTKNLILNLLQYNQRSDRAFKLDQKLNKLITLDLFYPIL